MVDSERAGHDVVLAAASMRCTLDPAVNIAKMEGIVAEAAAHNTDLLVFPEMAVPGYLTSGGTYKSPETLQDMERYRRVAETIPGPTTERMARLARRHKMTIQFGLAECNDVRTKLYNSCVIVGPAGLIGSYRKIHNQSDWPIFQPGSEARVFDTAIGRIGPFICADIHYPELVRILAIQGAQILTLSTAYPMSGNDPSHDPNGAAYEIHTDAAAMASQVWLVSSNQFGSPSEDGTAANYYGHSRIVSPFGEVADSGYAEGLVTACVDIEGEIARHIAAVGPRMARRRPELYGLLSDPRF